MGRAKEMILTGARWDARRALEAGLVSEVVPLAELRGAARAWAERVLALGPLAVRLAKAAVNASARMPLAAGLHYESALQAITFESADKQEGTTAFLEKRKPLFRGEWTGAQIRTHDGAPGYPRLLLRDRADGGRGTGASWHQHLRVHPLPRRPLELARYALAAIGGIGVLFFLFPEGR